MSSEQQQQLMQQQSSDCGQDAQLVSFSNKKQKPVSCYICKKQVWRITAHLRNVHNLSDLSAKEYRWRHATKGQKKKCMICGYSRVRLDRHLKRQHNLSSEDTRLPYLDAMAHSAPRLTQEREKLLVSEAAGGMPKVYTPPLFSKRFDFIWKDYADHVRRRIFTKVRSVEESVTRKVREAIFVIQIVDPRGDLQKLFQPDHRDGTPGERFERLAFAKITQELRNTTNVASSWANRLRSLINFLRFLSVYKQPTLSELGVSIHQIQNVIDRTKEFKSFAEKAKIARTNTIRQEQTSLTMERKRTVHQLRTYFDHALDSKTDSHWDVKARDALMCILVDTNASRPGPIINMTMEEFSNMTYEEKDEIWVIKVAAHKTCSQFGPATVFFDQSDKERLQRYADEVRSTLSANATEEYFFITKESVVKNKHKGGGGGGGRQLSTSAFCKVQRKLLGYTTTLKRKKDSERFRDTEAEHNVSELMLHSRETHKRNYCGTATLEERMAGFKSLNQSEVHAGPSTNKLFSTTDGGRGSSSSSSSSADIMSQSDSDEVDFPMHGASSGDNSFCNKNASYTDISQPNEFNSDEMDDISMPGHSFRDENVREREAPSADPPSTNPPRRHGKDQQLQHNFPVIQFYTPLLHPNEIPSKLKSWYQPATEVVQDAEITEIRLWTKQDHLWLHKFLGAYRGRDNVKSLKTCDIQEVLSTFPEFKKKMRKFSLKQIRDKLKGWNKPCRVSAEVQD